MKRSFLSLAAVGFAIANFALLAQPSDVTALFDHKETCANSGGYYFCEDYITEDCHDSGNGCEL